MKVMPLHSLDSFMTEHAARIASGYVICTSCGSVHEVPSAHYDDCEMTDCHLPIELNLRRWTEIALEQE
jgi:hypothetical protein